MFFLSAVIHRGISGMESGLFPVPPPSQNGSLFEPPKEELRLPWEKSPGAMALDQAKYEEEEKERVQQELDRYERLKARYEYLREIVGDDPEKRRALFQAYTQEAKKLGLTVIDLDKGVELERVTGEQIKSAYPGIPKAA